MKDLALSILASAVAVLAPIHMIIIVVGIVIFTDLATGIWAALKRGEKISSAGLRRSISKIVIYQCAIIIGFLIEKYLLGGVMPISKIAAALIGVTEALSIFENLNTISGNNIFKSLLIKLGSLNDKK